MGSGRRRGVGRRARAATGALVLAAAAFGLTSTGVASARQVGGAGGSTAGWRALAPAPAVPLGARRVGSVAGDRQMSGVVGLRPRDPALLARVAASVSTPGSSGYRRYMRRGGLRAEFGPTPGALRAVESYLTSRGLTVHGVSRDGLLVDFAGPSSAVESAVGARLSTFRLHGGREAVANTSSVELPAAVAADVQGVVGLDGLVAPVTALVHRGSSHRAAPSGPAHAAAAAPAACPAASTVAGQQGGWTDAQLASAYGVDPLLRSGADGAGQTVALFELEPYLPTDIRAFDSCYFGAGAAASMAARLHTVAVDGGTPAGAGVGEAALDVEDVSAFAPGATIDVYEAPMTAGGYLDEWNAIVQDDTAATVSTSWSMAACESQVATADPGLQQIENTLFEEAAAQGQTILAAAGDSGSDACAARSTAPVAPDLSVSDPASQTER
ncbi:MAG: S53 family peptidase, partial [Acidimicrobiales bacterium]